MSIPFEPYQLNNAPCREGKLTTVKKGLMYLVDPGSLDAYVDKMKSLGTYKFDWRHKKED
jgi:hypothetical protein